VNENTSSNKREKKRKRSSLQLPLTEDTINIPKLNKDISVSDMLTELGFREAVASSSRPKNDQFREPHIEEMPDMYDDELLFDIGDDGENYELIDDIEERGDGNHDEIESENEYMDADDEVLGDDESDDDTLEDDNNLFAAPELGSDDEDY
jgi:hypothetical protein